MAKKNRAIGLAVLALVLLLIVTACGTKQSPLAITITPLLPRGG
jgi:hypothetical protein